MSPWLKIALGIVLGGLAGFFYYKFIGCRSGSCPLAGNPWISTIWWAVIGALIGSGWK